MPALNIYSTCPNIGCVRKDTQIQPADDLKGTVGTSDATGRAINAQRHSKCASHHGHPSLPLLLKVAHNAAY